MSTTVVIYGLTDETGIRYIGQTRRALSERLNDHISDGRTCNRAKAAWLGALKERGLTPGIVALETTTMAGANDAERRHIRAARARGCDLVNGNQGGARQRPPAAPHIGVSIRFPGVPLAGLRTLAHSHQRSFNGEVIWALRAYIQRHEEERKRP